ncbi:hypothetical protein Desaci_1346 [Desulfosporosinus acidiphilus SJ4]|uniref:Uncharacterized protein n=1 Tax=Desulfosporosinus acidiphilus (strain DSM 22704 / JCM 16185 / SJ4) TaxID=646529 RepID=I4D3J8_DESAJ|nr:hypothetical protein [Desulfosporosinus acidiphilus]AFM40372.1 hypothetical protein Desaci_1346 [Desulfosporosinus acidiphilus SJ4]
MTFFKTKDSVVTGLLGGLVGTLFMDITNAVIYKAGGTEKLYGHLAGQFFVSPLRTNQRKNYVLGELLHFSVGSVFGLPTMYMLKKTGKDHYLSKGLVTSMLTWGLLYTGGQKIGLFKKLRFTKTHYSAAFNNVIYGLVSAKTMVSLADPTMFHDKKQSVNITINTSQNRDDIKLLQYQPSDDPTKTYMVNLQN